MAPYDADDADVFFGRDSDITGALARLDSVRLLAVTGPSGSGKSSLVRAGIVPALRRRDRTVVVVVPGADPETALAHALGGTAGDPIVVVDQLEEIYAGHQRPEVIGAFCARLAAYATGRAPVIVTIRSDHLGNLAAEAAMARLVEQGLHLVGPITGDALRATIEGPATAAGLRLESGLVDLLVREVEGEAAGLPLLSHALAETWERRDGRVLTVEGYRATGEIRGAVARSAEQLYASLPPDQQATLKSLLLRLVVPAADGEPVRAHLARRRLEGDAGRERVLDLLARARLVTADESSVELAHEAVARAWPRLRTWLEEDVAGQRVMHHLATTAEEWDSLARPDSELYRGARLEAALEWRDDKQPELTTIESAFLDASAAAAESDRRALLEQSRRQTRQNRRLRWALVAAATLLVAAVAGGFVAADQRSDALAGRRDAALSALVGDSMALRSNRRDLAALLAVEAYRLEPNAESESALFASFTTETGAERVIATGASLDILGGDGGFLPDGRTVVVADDFGALHLVNIETGAIEHLPALSDRAGYPHFAVADDGRYVAAGWRDFYDVTGPAVVTVWDLDTRKQRFEPITIPFGIGDLKIAPDGSTVAVSGGIEMRALTFDGATGEPRAELELLTRPDGARNRFATAALAFGPDGRLAVGSQAGVLRIVDPITGEELRRHDVAIESSASIRRLRRRGPRHRHQRGGRQPSRRGNRGSPLGTTGEPVQFFRHRGTHGGGALRGVVRPGRRVRSRDGCRPG